MNSSFTGSLSAETPWVAQEYFTNRSRNKQSFLSSSNTATSWCSTTRQSKPRRPGEPVLKDNTQDHRPTANDVLARLGVTKVGYDSRTPFIRIQSAPLERVHPNRSSALPLDQIQSKNFLDFYDSSSSKWKEKEETEEECLMTTETTKTNEDLSLHHQSYIEDEFDRLEPCYDWYLSREQKLSTIIETGSAHAAINLERSTITLPPQGTGRFLLRPRTAPEVKMTRRSDLSSSDAFLIIRKLNLLQRRTDSPNPSAVQQKVIDDKILLESFISGRDDAGPVVRSKKLAYEETLSWTTRNGEKGTTRSEVSRGRPESGNSYLMTSSHRDQTASEEDVVNADQEDRCTQKDSAIPRIAFDVTEENLQEQCNALGAGDHETDDCLTDEKLSIPSNYKHLDEIDDKNSPTIHDPSDDNNIAQLESSRRRSDGKSDQIDNSVRAMPAPAAAAAAAASVQRPKTAGREKVSSGSTRHRCSKKKASEKLKMTDSQQQKATSMDRETQRRESRRKKRPKGHRSQTLLISDIESSITTAVNDSSQFDQPFSSSREIRRSSEEILSDDSKLSNCTQEKNDEDSLSVRRRNLVDAALHRRLSLSRSSPSEGLRKANGRFPFQVDLVGEIGGEGFTLRRTIQVMDSHKPELELGERDGRRKEYHKSKQNGRIAFSQRSCRFELPLDMKQFERLSPQEYMRKYCRISPRRQILYKKIFLKYIPMTGSFPRKDLLKFLTELLGEAACDSDVVYICDLLQITDETRIDLELFSATAAVTERLLYPQFVTQHTRHIQDYKKEEIEKADFSSLLAKLNGVQVRPEMKRLVDAIK